MLIIQYAINWYASSFTILYIVMLHVATCICKSAIDFIERTFGEDDRVCCN